MGDSTCDFRFSSRAARTGAQPISFLMAQAVDNPNLISLAAGLVDYPSLPSDESGTILSDLLSQCTDGKIDPGKIPLQYGTTHGNARLRHLLLEHMAALDGVTPEQLDASADDVIVTTGSQQLLFILTDCLIDPGDIVITGWPSYFVYTGTLKTFGAEVRCVELDEHGMVPESLDRVLHDIAASGHLSRVKIVYVVSYHQNPTGLTVSAERKPQILDIVKRYSIEHRILVLEDAAYRELTYEGSPPPSIKKYDTTNEFVALAQTFSKPFSPGVKTGYGLLPRPLMDAVVNQKGNHDFGSSNLNQYLLLSAMESGVYAKHVELLCETYAAKRDAMLAALDEHLGGFSLEGSSAHWTRPSGGLYIYLSLPESMDTGRESALFSRSVAEGVLYVPGEYCYAQDPSRTVPRNHMRLSFGVPNIEQIREGVARLATAVKAVAG